MNSQGIDSNPWLRWLGAVQEENVALWRRAAGLPALLEKARGLRKGATPSEVIFELGRIKLLHYRSEEPPRYKTPLLFVFALVNRPYILDLKSDRSVVRHFVNAGFDTYLVDWGAPSWTERRENLNDYLNGYLPEILRRLRRRTGSEQVNLFGYCMGGTMSAMFTALYPHWVQSLILLAAGIDFARCDGLLNLWTQPEYFDVDKFVDAFGNCPAAFLQSSFLLLKPVQNLIEKPLNLFERLEDDAFVEDYLTMEMWLNDNVDVPGEIFREFVRDLYQGNLLTKNQMRVAGDLVDLRRITCPILNIVGQSDDLVAAAQSLPFNDHVGSKDRKSIVFPSGHIGLAVGSKAQKQLWPEAVRWLAERNQETTAQQQ